MRKPAMQINVLITGASRKVGLIRAFRETLDGSAGFTGHIIGVEVDPLSSGLYCCDRAYLVPGASDPDYFPRLLEICRREDVRLIVPTTDIELSVLAPFKKDFAEKGITVLVSDPSTINICNDKYLTYLFLREEGLPVPATCLPSEGPLALGRGSGWGCGRLENMTLPLFVKPRHGRGSIDCFKACNRKELDFFLEYVEEPVVQECLEGREYTIDLLAGFTGEVVSVVPRERISTAAGVSQKGTTVRDPGLIGLAVRVSKALHITGPANIQCFASNRGIGHNTGVELKLVEINPRFAGGYPLSHAAGASFPRLILKMVAGETVTPQIGEFREDLVMLRFDEGVFLHREELVKPEQ